MSELKEYDHVRVVSLKSATLSSSELIRAPEIGDEGAILMEIGSNVFIVESVAKDGSPIWMYDFHGSDLELISRPDPRA